VLSTGELSWLPYPNKIAGGDRLFDSLPEAALARDVLLPDEAKIEAQQE
jgi:hypothetical protein